MAYDCVILTDFVGPVWGRTAGAYRLATLLRSSGFSVLVIDCVTDFSEKHLGLILEKAVSERTLFIGIAANFLVRARSPFHQTAPTQEYSRAHNLSILRFAVNYCRSNFPEVKIIAGGPNARQLRFLRADLYLLGYADNQIVDIANRLRKAAYDVPSGTVISLSDTEFDLNNLGIVYHLDDQLIQGETLALELSRGCRFRCAFCGFPLNGRRSGALIKPADALRAELIRNYEEHGITRYHFADDTYNDSLEKVRYFRDIFVGLPFQVEFFAYLRLDLIQKSPEMVDLLAESGIKNAFFGLESLRDDSARAVGKSLGRELTLKTLEHVKRSWGDEVMTTAGLIVGLPNETPESAQVWMSELVDEQFPIHAVHIAPLYINSPDDFDNPWRSDLDRHPAKYGYTVEGTAAGMYWKNEIWDSVACSDLVSQFYTALHAKPGIKANNYYVHMNLLGYGLTHSELMSNSFSERTFALRINQTVKARTDAYQRGLLERLTR